MNRRTVSSNLFSFHKKLTVLTAKLTVLSTDPAGCTKFAAPGAGGFGAPNSATTSYGQGIKQIYMNSSAAATGNNVLAGNIQVQLEDNHLAYLGHAYNAAGPVTGAAIAVSTGFTIGTLYQIVTLGTSTTANWQAVGVPAGVTPVVGTVFMASTSSAGTGNGTAKALTWSNFDHLEVAGDPNSTLQPVGQASGFNGASGGFLYFGCWKAGVLTQPTDNTIIWLNMFFDSP